MGEVKVTKSTYGINIQYLRSEIDIPWEFINEMTEDINTKVNEAKLEAKQLLEKID